MTVLLFVGIAAGMLNVFRYMKGMGLAAGYAPAPQQKTPKPAQDEDEED
jgi:hypothetical protein